MSIIMAEPVHGTAKKKLIDYSRELAYHDERLLTHNDIVFAYIIEDIIKGVTVAPDDINPLRIFMDVEVPINVIFLYKSDTKHFTANDDNGGKIYNLVQNTTGDTWITEPIKEFFDSIGLDCIIHLHNMNHKDMRLFTLEVRFLKKDLMEYYKNAK